MHDMGHRNAKVHSCARLTNKPNLLGVCEALWCCSPDAQLGGTLTLWSTIHLPKEAKVTFFGIVKSSLMGQHRLIQL